MPWALAAFGLMASWHDLRTRTLPRWLMVVGLAAFGTAAVATDRGLAALVGAGLGDVWYAAVIGCALGPLGGLWALGLSSALGVLVGAALWAFRRGGWHTSFPLAPCLAIASVAVAGWPHW
jgi:prepilin signal peptidase PulO-like enzyme (type II secretory pathway)